jgi:hypothetical protein
MNLNMRKFALALLMFCVVLHAQEKDKVYRYTDSKGIIHYTDKPPAKDAKPVELPPLQTFPSTGTVNLSAPTAPVKVAQQFTLAITSPTADNTFRDADEAIAIVVSVTPSMPLGYGMTFTSDGAPLHEGVLQQTSFSVAGLERGSHTITATLSDPQGQAVASSSVTVHIKQPQARAK